METSCRTKIRLNVEIMNRTLNLKLHQIHDKVELLFDNIEAENDKIS